LRRKIIGLKITSFWSDKEKPVHQAGGIAKFTKEVKGRKILKIDRRAKFIIIDIEGDKSMFVHQKISGHLMYGKWKRKSQTLNSKFQINSKFKIQNSKQEEWVSVMSGPLRDDPQNQYIRYLWMLNDGHQLAMSDLRRFSRVILVKDKDVSSLKEIRKLGPEPLEIKSDIFIKLFKNKRGRLKQVLIDPFFIAGIGNIYSDEILWDSGFHPLSRVEKLKEAELKKVFISIGKILKIAITAKGSSVDDYRLPSGVKGGYQEIEKAYQQTGKKCQKRDGGIIQRIKIGQRSAHFCPKHQKLIE